jgi:hypothetical protein
MENQTKVIKRKKYFKDKLKTILAKETRQSHSHFCQLPDIVGELLK